MNKAVLRAFIAIDISEDCKDQIQSVTDELAARMDGMPVRWVPAEKIHLTLKFLGDVSETNVEMISTILTNQALQTEPFNISVGSLGVFPNLKRPRVIWIGVEAPEELSNLQRRIESETTRLGYAADNRPFSPHLTLGRVSRNAAPGEVRIISKTLRKHTLGFLGVSKVSQVVLYRSDLSPEGAVYTSIHSAPLGTS
jgi:2'-5' RNA ligase